MPGWKVLPWLDGLSALSSLLENQQHYHIPHLNAFQRLVERFRMVAATRPCVRSGRQPMTPDEMEQVKDFFRKNATADAGQACEELKMSIGKVLKILILSWPPSIEV